MLDLIKNYIKDIIYILIIIIELVVMVLVPKSDNNLKEDNVISIKSEEKKEENTKVRVDIKGAIKKEGVYLVDNDLAINDVIKLAGGLKKGASTKNINLSKRVYDEMVIYIGLKNELKSVSCKDNQVLEVKEESDNFKIASSDSFVSDYNNIDANKKITDNSEVSKIVNINSASKEELLSVSGIGSSKADSIISYRNTNGRFERIEDIKNVTGIGDSLFEKIKDFITV